MKKRSKVLFLIAWFILINILFCLPGSKFPSEDWMDKIWLDKWVHIGIFAITICLFKWTFLQLGNKNLWILVLAALYGLAIEIIQDQIIINRSFDWGDLIADIAGSVAGLWFWDWIKK